MVVGAMPTILPISRKLASYYFNIVFPKSRDKSLPRPIWHDLNKERSQNDFSHNRNKEVHCYSKYRLPLHL